MGINSLENQVFTAEEIQSDLRLRLAAVRGKKRRTELLLGALYVASALLGVVLLSLALEGTFRFGPAVRTVLFWGSITGVAGLAAWRIGRPLLRLLRLIRSESDNEIAASIGSTFPEIHDRLVNGLQLFDERNRGFYSSQLVDAALGDLYNTVAPLKFDSVVTYGASRRVAGVLGSSSIIALILVFLFPASFAGSAYRLWSYSATFAAPRPFIFIVEPGDKEVVKGSSLAVTVRIQGEQQSQVTLVSRREGEEVEESHTLDRLPDSTFRYEFVALKSTTSYAFAAGSMQSPTYRLTVVDRPVAKMLRVSLRFPPYSALSLKQLDDNVGDIIALKGTRASFSVEANKKLLRAQLVFSDSAVLSLRVEGTKASGDVALMKERSYCIALFDSDGLSNADPIQYSIRLQQDAYPTVAVLVPGTNLDVTDKTVLPMLFKISDDYGFSHLRLAYRLVQSRYGKLPDEPTYISISLPKGAATEALIPFSWSIEGLNLVPEDAVQYYVEVLDNDVVSGPKSGVSDNYMLRYPSIEEVFADADREHNHAIEMTQEAMKQAEEAKRTLEELKQDLKKEQQKADWQDQKKTEELIKKYEDLRKTMEEASKTVDRVMNQLQNNRLLSQETVEKYQELQQLLQQMNSPELAEAMKRLQQAMEQLSTEQMKQALQQFTFSEENFRKSIERTLNLLKRIQIEQKLDEMITRADAMAQQQEQLQRETERTAKERQGALPDLAEKQRDLSKDAASLKQELSDLKNKMEEFPGEMPLKEMQDARNEFEESNLDGQLKDIAQQLSEQQAGPAIQGQQQARQKMNRVVQQMQQAKKSMQQHQQQQIVNEMRRALQDLLEISRRQEALKKGTESLEQNSAGFRNQAQGQMDAIRDLSVVLDRLGALSNKSFSVTPEMGKSLGEAMQRMGESMQSLDQRNGTAAGRQQSAAMGALNEAAMQVQNALSGMMQAGSGGMGMSGFLQRLQRLTSQQQAINQGTEGLTPEQREAMGRLAAEQGAVRKSLEQLTREASTSGQLSRMLGDLRKVAEEMREVQTDLAQGEVNPETLRRQEQILSRLLDSQRSTQERDFENRRKAQSGTNISHSSPGALDLSSQEGKSKLRRDLMRALQEGYSREYEELIRKYFEALDQ